MTGDPERSPVLEEWLPDLVDWGYRITSDIDFEYNCIAWAAGDKAQQWWPIHGYWPPEVRRELSVEAFPPVGGTSIDAGAAGRSFAARSDRGGIGEPGGERFGRQVEHHIAKAARAERAQALV